MSTASKIEWTDATWNPVVGCSIVSPGCTNCYAMGMARRIELMGSAPHYNGTTKPSKAGAVWTGKLAVAPEKTMLAPMRWRVPKKIFVNSMGDLFHEDAKDWWVWLTLAVMGMTYDTSKTDENNVIVECRQRHIYQVLTKRAERMRAMMTELHSAAADFDAFLKHPFARASESISQAAGHPYWMNAPFSTWRWVAEGCPGLWLGISAERQQEADERIPHLLQTPAAIRFVSCEPLLGPIDLRSIPIKLKGRGADALASYPMLLDGLNGFCRELWNQNVNEPAHGGDFCALDWIIVGGESGPGARPMHPDWARSLRDQCAAAGVPFFFKQFGEFKDGSDFKPGAIVVMNDGRACEFGSAALVDMDREKPVPPTNPTLMLRVGKKAAGRLLDGKEHNGFPGAAE